MRRRIVVLAVLTAALSTVLFGVPLALVAHRDALRHEVDEARGLATGTALDAAPVLATGGDVPDLPTSAERDLTVALYDAGGHRVTGAGPAVADAAARAAGRRGTQVTDGDADGAIVVAVPVTVGGQVVAVARAATPRAEVTDQTIAACGVLALIAAGAVLLGGLVAGSLAGRLVRPLRSLETAALRLGEGDFTVRSARTGVPELDEAGAALDATAERLGTLVGRERAFAGRASHQLRTPMTALRLHLERARSGHGTDRDGVREQALDDALRETDRLEDTVREVLALTREDRGSGPLDVPRLLADLTATWSAVLAGEGRRLHTHCEPDLPATGASPAAVRQLLTVLLDNAAGHGRGDVVLTARDAGGLLALDVSDEGPGQDGEQAAVAARIRDGLSGSDGTSHGMGLPLARSLAEAEGARLRLAGTLPTTVSLVLPARS